MWLDSGEYEQYAKERLLDPQGQINVAGREMVGSTFAIGEPWVEGSNCTHMLVSLPYPYGPDFELCAIGDGHLHIYWLLPITEREHDYKVQNGADALAEVFETKGLEYWKTKRKSVI